VGTRQVLSKPIYIPGTTLVENLTDADLDGTDLVFTAPVEYVMIYNSSPGDALTALVNGILIGVPAATSFGPAKVGVTPDATVVMGGDSSTFIVQRWE
jgi:hypothetical protein